MPKRFSSFKLKKKITREENLRAGYFILWKNAFSCTLSTVDLTNRSLIVSVQSVE